MSGPTNSLNSETNTSQSRRSFIAATASATASIAAANSLLRSNSVFGQDVASEVSRSGQRDPSGNPIAVFVKHVQRLSYDELGRRLKSIGVDGVEATLRPGGQILPGELSQKLGEYVDALAEHGQRVVIAASNVNAVNAESENYIQQLAKYRIPYLRMAYYKYDIDQPILPQLERFAKQAQELAKLCEAHGVTALYQNHAGRNYVGAALWDLQTLLAGIDPKQLAVALDIRHTTLELTTCYPVGYRAVRPHVGATYIKDFDWKDGKAQNVPLGEGRSKPLFDLIRKDGFVGPMSLHMEYTDHQNPDAVEPSWQAIAKDVKVLQSWLAS